MARRDDAEDLFDDEPELRPVRSSEKRMTRRTLRGIARYQRYLLLALLAYVTSLVGLGVVAVSVGPGEPGAGTEAFLWVLLGAVLLSGLASVVAMWLLANALFGPVWATLLAVLTLFACVGVLALLIVNQVATNRLKEYGVKVGFLGADPATI